ncbi:MAG: DNA polymerase III subunit chi [Planktomarina sp.]
MGAAYFYHLTRQSTHDALVPLLTKCLENSWRVIVRGTDDDHLKQINDKLWSLGADEFLPHGLSGGEHDDDQPILLTKSDLSNRDCLICIDGADVTSAEINAAERVCILFQDEADHQMNVARAQWSNLTGQGVAAKYWSQASGRWELKSEKGGT